MFNELWREQKLISIIKIAKNQRQRFIPNRCLPIFNLNLNYEKSNFSFAKMVIKFLITKF